MNPVSQQNLNAVDKTIPFAGRSGGGDMGSVTVVFELGEQTLRVLSEMASDIKRIADHFDPQPADIVDTPYIANHLGCTTTWIAQMVRDGEIPKGCIVPGSGNGRQWKFYRRKIEDWLASR
jgi:Rieske Fe-S protein